MANIISLHSGGKSWANNILDGSASSWAGAAGGGGGGGGGGRRSRCRRSLLPSPATDKRRGIPDRYLGPAIHPGLLGGRPTRPSSRRLGIPLAPLLPPVLGNERSVHLGNPIGLLPGIRDLDRTSEEAEAILGVEGGGGGGHVLEYHPCLPPQSIPTKGNDLQDLVVD